MKVLVALCAVASCLASAQLLRADKMGLKYNPETKHYEKALLGQDGHDQQPHAQALLGQDGHDQQPHAEALLGQDNHDQLPHGRAQLGGDGHDQQPHGQHILGQDGHDQKPHGQRVLGQDGHDQRPHGQQILGQDGHDQRPHGKQLLGQDGHDQRPHGKQLLGQDGHDQRPHGQQLLGQDGHGQRRLGQDGHDQRPHGQRLLGQDGHDQQPHMQRVLGQDGHDQRPHGQRVFGQDGHDQRPHGKRLLGQDGHGQRRLGQDGHDQRPHGQHLLGQDGHDQRSHKQKPRKHNKHKARKILGQDNHDRRAHKTQLLGLGSHDYKKHGKKTIGGGSHDLGHMGMFKTFMKQHSKTYKNKAEFKKRFKIFHQNMKKAHILQQNERGTAKYGPTKFADLTEREFRRMLGFHPHMKPATSSMERAAIPDVEVPVSFDWREHGVVTPIKNQGMCGSCWAFSTTGNVEGQWALKHKQLYSLSEQELVDCDTEDEGCNGGLPENAYDAIAKLGGLEVEDDYPYEGDDETCHFNRSLAKVTVNGSVELPADEVAIAKWLTQNGPISIGINANALQFYVGGVSHPLKFLCNPKSLDHGMLIVGYGIHTTKYLHRKQPFWIVKNSWGEDWGEQGYYRVYRGDGTCGVDQMATSAIVP
ncbi:trophozoite cysteine proteinase-like isoform X10 [Eriocheir sinensis]|uniref:trophozoite cysteine proteinase-like isoform X10 n=1 Tax=Eriocheir sinensis TaxID=95602 RepID=UPI0021CA3D14|nr:trophozoite cysteine proteinase-like isoform X10 [Eriocheir sinensis]